MNSKKKLSLSEFCGLLAKAGNDLAQSIEKYNWGGPGKGKSLHMKEALAAWEELRKEFFPR